MKRSLLVIGFLPLLAVNLQAMERPTQGYPGVAQAVSQINQLISKRFRDLVTSYIRALNSNRPESELTKMRNELSSEMSSMDNEKSRIEARIATSTGEVRTSNLIKQAWSRYNESLDSLNAGRKKAEETYGSGMRRPGEGGETDRPARYTMDFNGAKAIAGDIKTQLASVREAGKVLSSDQKKQLNDAAGIMIF